MIDPDSPFNLFPNACPCCGYATLDERGDWDICCICWWEDSGQDNHNANGSSGGPNGKLSLTQARINFVTDGISCPSRSDLREKQEPTQSHARCRQFEYEPSTQTIREPRVNWKASVFELDTDRMDSRFKAGDSVTYFRRDSDSTNRIGTIETLKWNEIMEFWCYRLLDDSGKAVEKWFDGFRLQPSN